MNRTNFAILLAVSTFVGGSLGVIFSRNGENSLHASNANMRLFPVGGRT